MQKRNNSQNLLQIIEWLDFNGLDRVQLYLIENLGHYFLSRIFVDAVGQEIKIPIDNNGLDVRNLKSGMYFIKIVENSNISSCKLIKK